MVSICLFDYCNPLGIITPIHTHILSKYIFSGWKTIEMGFFQNKLSLIKSFFSLFDRHMLFWAVLALEFSFQTTVSPFPKIFYFGLCVVCSSSIYELWLPLWSLQTLITQLHCDMFNIYFDLISDLTALWGIMGNTLHKHKEQFEMRLKYYTFVTLS